jgi:hypothetical protein
MQNLSSIYVPFTHFEINNKTGELMLFEEIVKNGPVYKLIVHESEGWEYVRENLIDPSSVFGVTVISDKEAERYAKKADLFFSSIIEEVRPYYLVDNKKVPSSNLTFDLSRFLSYILIANKYKATIYEDDILTDPLEWITVIKNNRKAFSDDSLKRIEAIEALIRSYESHDTSGLSMNKSPAIYSDFARILGSHEIQNLSQMRHRLGLMNIRKNQLIREIKARIAKILPSKEFRYLTDIGVTVFCIQDPALSKAAAVLVPLIGYLTECLSELDLYDYAPPVQDPLMFLPDPSIPGIQSFGYKPFNHRVAFYPV